MENMPVPPIPTSPIASPEPSAPVPIKFDTPHAHRLPFRLIILVLVLGAVATYLLYPQLARLYPKLGDDLSGRSSQASPSPKPSYDPVIDADKKLVYLRHPDPNNYPAYEAWLIDPATGEEEQLPLNDFLQAYKYYGSTKLYYRPVGEEAEYRVLDLATGIEESHKLIAHPDPAGRESVNMDNMRMISSDGKYLVFSVDFFKPCPSPSPFPSGFEGGFGPCTPDENLATPYGYYLYDLEKRTSIYLGDLVRVSRWDTKNQKLYYTKQSSTKVLDLATKSIVHLDASSHFGYFTYPLLASNQLVSHEGATGNTSSETPFSKISLIDLDTQKQTEIDTANDWAIIQPFIDSSPGEENVIYTRTNLVLDGLRRFDLYKYNVENGTTTRLTPADDTVSYRYYGDWINDHTFVTTADTLEAANYTNSNNYLISIDIETGTIKRLTPHDKVYSFAMQ